MLICSKEAFARCPTAHLCGRREESKFTEGSDCDKFNQEIEKKTQTNADRIRAMTDGVLAQSCHAVSLGYTPWCDHHCEHLGEDGCCDCVRNWLRQPVQPTIIIEDDPKVHSGLVTED